MANTRKVRDPMKPKHWVAHLRVTDTPGPGEDYLTGEQILDNVLKRSTHAGVEIVDESVEEVEEAEEETEVEIVPERSNRMWPMHETEEPPEEPPIDEDLYSRAPEVSTPQFTTIEPARSRSILNSIKRWMRTRH